MEPKTKLQKLVVELTKKLPAISEEQKAWAFEKCLDKYAVLSRKTLFCLECGHSWKDGGILASAKTCTCPSCGKKLHIKTGYQRLYSEAGYFGIMTTQDEMQVVRMFFAKKVCKKGQKAIYSVSEVMQHWIDFKGRITTLAKQVRGLTQYYDAWIFDSFLEIRLLTYNAGLRASIAPYKIFPQRRILPVIRRNGYNGKFYGLAPQNLFSTILQDSIAETLLKAGQGEMLKHRFKSPDAVEKFWPSIKICIRNGYKIADASLWVDYLKLLDFFGRDLLNQKFVCPENLKAEHDRYMAKKQAVDRKKRLIELQETIETEQGTYAAQKGKFFGLLFQQGDIIVKPLETVAEFVAEGEVLNHCIFTSEYFKKPESLILSARISNQPVETIEVSLESLSVVQCRGADNHPTKYHSQILTLVQNNIHQIAQRL